MITLATTDAYLAEAIADELLLARLLDWANVRPPSTVTPNCWIFGTHHLARGHERNASAPCPRWRRDWEGAGQLIARCHLDVVHHDDGVTVTAPRCDTVSIYFADHPDHDSAIRAAMCRAAIPYLTLQRTLDSRRTL